MSKAYREPAMPDKNLGYKLTSLRNTLRHLEDLRPKFERVGVVLRPLARLLPIDYLITDAQLLVRLQVQSMDDVAPVLEELSVALDVDFDQTKDSADFGWRQFESTKTPWLRVDAELSNGGAGGEACRRVVVGYQQVPVYEIKCGDEAAQPDTPPPGAGPQPPAEIDAPPEPNF